jgi:GTP cyclohydrolase I/GTP cyclohydrolase-4
MSTTRRSLPADLPESRPASAISLSRAGVTRSAKAIRIRHNGDERLFHAELACFSDLNPEQKGVHMSRFEEEVNEAIDDVVIGEALVIEALAERIATTLVASRRALRSEVTIQTTTRREADADYQTSHPGDVRPDRHRGGEHRGQPPRRRRPRA